jgi:hypothetical protein
MLGRQTPRKVLASALSRVELSKDTILRHAQAVLEHAELIEIPASASALSLWLAALQRAEAEGRVPALVQAVLEENPAADALKRALGAWLQAAERAALRARSHAPDSGAPDSRAALPSSERPETAPVSHTHRPGARPGSWRALWVLSPLLVLLLAWQLLAGPSPRGILSRWIGSSAPTPRDLETALLACWNRSEGGGAQSTAALARPRDGQPRPPAATVTVRLAWGQPGQVLEREDMLALLRMRGNVSQFRGCFRAAKRDLLARMAPGSVLEASVSLPLPP